MGKLQIIRLADIFVLGPVMIFAGLQSTPSPFVRQALVVIGLATVIFNGANFINEQK